VCVSVCQCVFFSCCVVCVCVFTFHSSFVSCVCVCCFVLLSVTIYLEKTWNWNGKCVMCERESACAVWSGDGWVCLRVNVCVRACVLVCAVLRLYKCVWFVLCAPFRQTAP